MHIDIQLSLANTPRLPGGGGAGRRWNFLNTTEEISSLLSLESPLHFTVESSESSTGHTAELVGVLQCFQLVLHSWIVKGNSKLNPSVSITFCLSAFLEVGQDYLFVLIFTEGADHLTLEGRGVGVFEKNFCNCCKRLSEEKNCMQQKCNRKLMGKKGGKKYTAHQIARKKHS